MSGPAEYKNAGFSDGQSSDSQRKSHHGAHLRLPCCEYAQREQVAKGVGVVVEAGRAQTEVQLGGPEQRVTLHGAGS